MRHSQRRMPITSKRNAPRFRRLQYELLESRQLLAVFTVNSILDLGDSFLDDGICDTRNNPFADPPAPPSGICTLPAAFAQANHNDEDDIIRFAIAGDGVPLIDFSGAIIKGSVELDASTQSSGKVEIHGTISFVGAGGHLIRGFVFNTGGVRLLSNNSVVVGSMFGTKPDGKSLGEGDAGIDIEGDANRIGGPTIADRNIVVGDISVKGNNNQIQGNYFGTDILGEVNLHGARVAVVISEGKDNSVGGDSLAHGNVFVGASDGGAIVVRAEPAGPEVSQTIIKNNRIGTNPSGMKALGTRGPGIALVRTTNNVVLENLIAATGKALPELGNGIVIGSDAHRNHIQGNMIGTNRDGTMSDSDSNPENGSEFGNPEAGVLIHPSEGTATENIIGGALPTQSNVISGNSVGVRLVGDADRNRIEGNAIGTDIDGMAALPNGTGVQIELAGHNIVGGTQPNIISGNISAGVHILGAAARDNLVAGNVIGLNADGSAPLPNRTGVIIGGAIANCIGGSLPTQADTATLCELRSENATGNIISGNREVGIQLSVAETTQNIIQANRIGTNLTGLISDPDGIPFNGDEFGNGFDGIAIMDGADSNVIGGKRIDQSNVISGNKRNGIILVGSPANLASGNVISGNYIGTDALGNHPLGNGMRGVELVHAGFNVIGGESGARNIISGNRSDGLRISFNTSTKNRILNNHIGVSKDGESEIRNQGNGIFIAGAPENVIGDLGETNALGNVIAGNSAAGVRIDGVTATGNILRSNAIGTQANRTDALGNADEGIYIFNAPYNVIGAQTSIEPTSLQYPGNVISGNHKTGITIEGATAFGNKIGANLIGTTITGTAFLANAGAGIYVLDAANTRIGASLPSEIGLSGNTISANLHGIRLEANTNGTIIGDNKIGTDWQGQLAPESEALGNRENGIEIRDSSDNFVGGLANDGGAEFQVPRNIIAGNKTGVAIIGNFALRNRIQRNSIFSNQELGIDLDNDGVTANDEPQLDGDTGPNLFQNFPKLNEFDPDGNLTGMIVGAPNAMLTLDFYKSQQQDPTGNGEGQIWVKSFTAETDDDGTAQFEISNIYDDTKRFYSVTATDSLGNTSEFSEILKQPDLAVDSFQLDPRSIVRRGSALFLPYSVTVRNVGTGPAANIEFDLRGNGEQLHDLNNTFSLAADASRVFSGEWNVTSYFNGIPRGTARLEIRAVADPNDKILEMAGGSNQQEANITADGRPMITDLRKEFAEGVFLEDVTLSNTLEVFVDWNGNLDGVTIGATELPNISAKLNGTAITPVGGSISLNSATPTKYTIAMGTDLDPGGNVLEIFAATDLFQYRSESRTVRYGQVDTVPWIEKAFWTVSATTGPFERVANYKSTVFFPQFASGGVFGIPVERVGVAGGAFGQNFPQAQVQVDFHSNRKSEVKAELKVEVEVGGNETGGGTGSITGKLRGELDATGPDLNLVALSGSVEGKLVAKTPAIPFPPPFSAIRAQARIGVAVEATLEIRENEAGELSWPTNLILGLEPSLEGVLIVGAGPVTIEGGIGGLIHGDFSLAGNPCIPLGGRVELYLRAKATFLAFEGEIKQPFPFDLPKCGGAGEAEHLDAPTEPWTVGLQPRYASRAQPADAEGSTNALPSIQYPYAKPALARNDDGSMTLVYVDEDPDKPDGQHLEIFSSTWDGTSWSVPIALTDDTLIDDVPSVVYDDDGRTIAMWSHVKNTLDDPSHTLPQDVMDELEIVYSIRETASSAWSAPMALTSDNTLDFMPRLNRNAQGQIMAMWLRDDDNAIPIFPNDSTTELGSDYWFSTWNGSEWSAPAVAVANVQTNEAPQFAMGNGTAIVVWSEDSDANLSTDVDRDVQGSVWNGASWSAATNLSSGSDSQADLSPRVIYIDDQQAAIRWVRRGVAISDEEADLADQLFGSSFENNTFTEPQLLVQTDAVADLQLLRAGNGDLVHVFHGLSDIGQDLFVSIQPEGAELASEPLQVTSSVEAEWAFNAFINGSSELEVIYLGRTIGSEPLLDAVGGEGEVTTVVMMPTFGSSRLAVAAQQLLPNLRVEQLSLDDTDLTPGAIVQGNVTVANRGARSSTASTILLTDDGQPFASEIPVPALAPGATATISFDWEVPPQAAAAHLLRAVIDPHDVIEESNESDNQAQVTVLLPDVAVLEVVSRIESGTIVVTAIVGNVGASPTDIPVEVQLKLDDPVSGATVVSAEITESIPPGETKSVVLVIDLASIPLDRSATGFVVIGSMPVEGSRQNNSGFVLVTPFTSWRNASNPFDVNLDSQISPIDALLVINDINANQSRQLEVPAAPPFFLDVNGDFFLSAIDALLVINFLNGEVGESEPTQVYQSELVVERESAASISPDERLRPRIEMSDLDSFYSNAVDAVLAETDRCFRDQTVLRTSTSVAAPSHIRAR